jgi:4-amino-4-deoxy-L-arabinose transferase-like glycosyltransferase
VSRRLPIAVLTVGAFALRLVVRLLSGEVDFLHNGYTLYVAIARSLLEGHGLCFAAGVGCARRMPLYPLLVAPLLASGHLFPWLPVIQAAFGAATVLVVWKIGLEVADDKTATCAAAAAALNPYAVVHDTALQETSLFNLLVALAVWLLLRLRRQDGVAAALGAGAALALAMLTTGRIALFLPCAVAWAASLPGDRARRAALVALPIAMLVGGWAARNRIVVGVPVLSSETGKNLWVGNNEWTFSHFPGGSIDASQTESFRSLSPARRAVFAAAGGEVAQDRLEGTWARMYAARHPWAVAWGAARKVWSAASAQYTPARGRAEGAIYRTVFLVVHVLAGIGLWRLRSDRRAVSLILLLLGSFIVTTAVFWAHTHKSYLDGVLFVCAASILQGRQSLIGVKAAG